MPIIYEHTYKTCIGNQSRQVTVAAEGDGKDRIVEWYSIKAEYQGMATIVKFDRRMAMDIVSSILSALLKMDEHQRNNSYSVVAGTNRTTNGAIGQP